MMTKGLFALVLGGIFTTAEMTGGLYTAREMFDFHKSIVNVMGSRFCGTPVNQDDVDQVQGLMTALDPNARAPTGFSAKDQAMIAQRMPSLCGYGS